MVGVVNPANGTSIRIQIAAAQNATLMLGPGQSWPAEGTRPGSVTYTPPVVTPSSKPNPDKTLSGKALAGIAIATIVVILLCVAVYFFILRSNNMHQIREQSEVTELQADDIIPEPEQRNLHFNTPAAPSGDLTEHILMSPLSEAPTHFDEKSFEVGGHPAFRSFSNQGTTYELAGDHPTVAELGPYGATDN